MNTRIHHAASIALIIAATMTPCPAATVAYWNFNSLTITTANPPGTGDVPTSITANLGTGSIDLTPWTGTVDDFGGTTTNSLNSDPAGSSLSLIAGSGTTGNGGSILISFSMTGLSNPTVTFATQGTSTGFTSNQLAWSLNGTNFTNIGSTYSPPASFGLQSFDLAAVDAIDNAPNVWLRLTFNGATGATGNNRIDNLQVDALVPEPTASMIAAISALCLLQRHRRQ